MNKLIAILPALVLVPALALAQDPDLSSLDIFFRALADIVGGVLVPLVFALAIVGFFWGLFKTLIWGGADESKRSEGKQLMLWSIIALAVMVLIYGIIFFIGELFGIGYVTEIDIPSPPSP